MYLRSTLFVQAGGEIKSVDIQASKWLRAFFELGLRMKCRSSDKVKPTTGQGSSLQTANTWIAAKDVDGLSWSVASRSTRGRKITDCFVVNRS